MAVLVGFRSISFVTILVSLAFVQFLHCLFTIRLIRSFLVSLNLILARCGVYGLTMHSFLLNKYIIALHKDYTFDSVSGISNRRRIHRMFPNIDCRQNRCESFESLWDLYVYQSHGVSRGLICKH